MFTLIVDDRERAVEPFMCNIPHIIQRITTGDFSITVQNTVIAAIFERKTLIDYAKSLQDGRHAGQKQKVEELRHLYQGCQIYYIIENNPAFPPDDKKFGNILYKDIEASFMHLEVRLGVQIIKTKDPSHTASILGKMLISFQKCWPDIKDRYPTAKNPTFSKNVTIVLNTIFNDPSLNIEELMAEVTPEVVIGAHTEMPSILNIINSIQDVNSENQEMINELLELVRESSMLHNLNAMATLQSIKHKSHVEIILNMWMQIPGVGSVTANALYTTFKISDYINGTITTEQLMNLKEHNQIRFLTEKLTKAPDKALQIKILQCIPGFNKRAESVINKISLPELFKMKEDEITKIKISIDGGKENNIGKAKSAYIAKVFNL